MLVIVVVDSPKHARFFEERLPSSLPSDAELVVVIEEWPAGNGLGTLLAWQKVGRPLGDEPAVLYAASGKGSRLEPLTSLEGGCKARVTLPGTESITLLEAVIRNTLPLVHSRPGRLTVCWVDQLYSAGPFPPPQHPIEILGKRIPLPDVWDLSDYGVLSLDPVRPLGKVDRATFTRLFPSATELAISLGNFTIEEGLLNELTALLANSPTAFNVEQGLWIPLAYDQKTCAALGGTHWEALAPLRPLTFGLLDIGPEGNWWDFGQFAGYLRWCQLHADELTDEVHIEGNSLVYKSIEIVRPG